MKEFFVGLLVILMIGVLSVVGVLLFPLLLVMGFFLRWVFGFLLLLAAIWLIGKLTLLLIDYIRRPGAK